MNNRSYRKWAAYLCAASVLLTGCSDMTDGTDTADTAVSEESPDEEDSADASASDAQEDTSDRDAQEDAAEEETSDASGDTSGLITPVSAIDVEDQFSERDLDPSWEDRDPIYVTMSGNSASADSADGITVSTASDGEVQITITEEGVYVFSGTLRDGQIFVNCSDEEDKVQIVLNGADITNDDGACILVLSADKCFLTMAEGSDNTLSDTGEEYVQPEETDKNVDGVVFADCDLSIGGDGTLTVNAGYDNGIVSKNDLKITGGMLVISSAGKGIEANDSIRAAGGVVVIDAEDDALNTDNDEESGRGYIYIEEGTFTLSSGDDGIHAATALLITGGTITVTESYEGLEADSIDITGGTIDVTASDDGLNASTSSGGGMDSGMGGGSGGSGGGRSAREREDEGSSAPSGDDATPDSGDGDSISPEEGQSRNQDPGPSGESEGAPDGAGPDGADAESGGEMPSGGNIPGNGDGALSAGPADSEAVGLSAQIFASDAGSQEDGASDAGSERSASAGSGGGGGGMGTMSSGSTDAYIRISGGFVYINADGDGIDSNGSLYIEGGTIYVDGPVSSGDGAIDYGDGDVEAIVSGGTIIAVGSSGMAENFNSATQYEAMVNFSSQIAAGTQLEVSDADGNVVLSYTPSKAYQSVVFSSPDLVPGDYTVTAGEESITVTISDYINSSGSSGFGMGGGGSGSGMGGGGSRGGGR